MAWVPVVVFAIACSSSRRPPPAAPRVDPAVAEVIALEADRGAAVARLGELASSGDREVRVRAVHALGRLGDEAATARLVGLIADADPEVRRAAVWALGVAGAGAHEAALVERYGVVTEPADRAALAWTLGRAGTAAALPALIAAVQDADPDVRVAGGIGLGMLGRRGIAIDEGARLALSSTAGHVDPRVRHAAAWALAREHAPPADLEVATALGRLSRDPDPEVRAAAVLGLGKREGAAPSLLVDALADADWRVRVEAARALSLPRFAAAQRQALAAHLAREWALAASEGMRSPRLHVVIEGLIGLAGSGDDKLVAKAAAGIEDGAMTRMSRLASDAEMLAASAVHCLAVAIRVRAGAPIDDLLGCGGVDRRGWPVHLRRALAADTAAAAGAALPPGDPRRRALETHVHVLVTDGDPRVRAAALTAAAALARSGDQEALERRLRTALADKDLQVAGTAADIVAELAAPAPAAGAPAPGGGAAAAPPVDAETARARWAPLVALVVERAIAAQDGDVELRLTFLGALTRARAGREACLRAHTDLLAPVRRAARECLTAIDGTDPGPGSSRAGAEAPPYAPDGNTAPQRWRLRTTKGNIEIELDPARAPWHVAALVGMTRSGVYDGRLWHRVVPGFVTQGGSPNDSAWGGPDFVIPGEPTPGEFRRGTIGIADSGMDTGGSQFFVTHGRAPHLDGRYTIVGQIVSGQEVVDALIVGDAIVRADLVEPTR